MADIKKANRTDLSAAKKVEKVVKPAASVSAQARIPGKVHIDLNPHKVVIPPPYKDFAPPPYRRCGTPPYKDFNPPYKDLIPHKDVHTDIFVAERENIVVHLAEGASLNKDHILQLQNYGAKIENKTLTIPAAKAAEFECFVKDNDLKTLLEF
ncbi:hypothetical protein [uncultured Fibrobacter sp.]|uniref:hypothetical protein n=1 Tax=uncultured Fibrobacter sp. TaxID=261512 RepID=UPI00260CBC2F|nr:hypothetical protein [uncultured Fibrobacter sp.]